MRTLESIGLKNYLNDSKAKHNGWGYDDFVKMVESKVGNASMARTFKVSRTTIVNWLSLYYKEGRA